MTSPSEEGFTERILRHHPGEATLIAYAAGSLRRQPALVVATHLTACPQCRAAVRLAETIGGVLLADLPPASLSAQALRQTLERLDDVAVTAEQPKRLTPELPSPLDRLTAGRFRWLAPGIHYAELEKTGDGTLGLLRVRPGIALPRHGHGGLELTCVIEGAYGDEGERYGSGDLQEVDEQVSHRLVALPPTDCLCVIAVNGSLRFETWLSRAWAHLLPF